MTVAFFGHRRVGDPESVGIWLYHVVEGLISQGAEYFFLGGYGEFDSLAASIVRAHKKKYPGIQAILVLPYLNRTVDTSLYDGTTYPPLEAVPYRFAIDHRNRWMAENAAVAICYVLHSWGGAAKAMGYAKNAGCRLVLYGME